MNKIKRLRKSLPAHVASPDYVGYGHPPKQHQFKKGESGNPKGRPRKPKSLKTLIANEFKKRITILEDGEEKRISKMELLAKQFVNRSLKGEVRTLKLILQNLEVIEAAASEDWRINESAQKVIDALNQIAEEKASRAAHIRHGVSSSDSEPR